MNVADIVANFVPGVQLFMSIFDIVPLFLGRSVAKIRAKGNFWQKGQ